MTMDMSEKMAREIAQQLGLGSSKNVSRQTVQSLEGKSDEELVKELGRLQAQLAANNIGPEQQKAMVKQLMPMMNGKQRARLEKIIRILG